MPSQEYTELFEEPMQAGAKNAVAAVMADTCNRYQAKPITDEQAGGKTNWVLKCETELAAYFGQKFGLGVSSGGLAIMLGLKAMHRVLLGDVAKEKVKVYSNSFTFNAVPSAIVNAGFTPTFVETSPLLTIDLDDLERQVKADLASGIERGNMVLVLSFMRGRIPDMDRVLEICNAYNVLLLEDNAHGYGAEWKGRKMGNFGLVSAMSTQANKLINTGEGGFVFTSCDRMQAFFMLCAGCYEDLYKKHETMQPSKEAFEEMRFSVPNFSCRLSNIQAAVAYPQIEALPKRIAAHNSNYDKLQQLVGQKLRQAFSQGGGYAGETFDAQKFIEFIPQLADVTPVFDSLQLRLKSLSPEGLQHMINAMNALGFKLQIFADKHNARYYRSWHYCVPDGDRFAGTDLNLEGVVDMRLLAHDTDEDVQKQATSIVDCFREAHAKYPSTA